MALGRKNGSVARTNSGADVFGLAGFLGGGCLISNNGLVWKRGFDSALMGTYSEQRWLTSRF